MYMLEEVKVDVVVVVVVVKEVVEVEVEMVVEEDEDVKEEVGIYVCILYFSIKQRKTVCKFI